MKILYLTVLVLRLTPSIGQTNWRDTTNGLGIKNYDTCKKIENNAIFNLVTKTRHSQPLYIANDIIVSADDLSKEISLIKKISVINCPEAFNKFGYIGYNGVIIISTSQEFLTVTPNSIRQEKFKTLKGNIIFALNGDVITDTAIKISSQSVKQIELLKPGVAKGGNGKFTNYTCIDIWTLTEAERKPMAGLCRGVRITQN